MKSWLGFWIVQFIMLVVGALGVLPIAAACAFRAWTPAISTQWAPDAPVKAHTINVWAWSWMNYLWGNPEDGVTGTPAYNPTTSGWSAFTWSALRNYADNLKYVYAEPGGPFYARNFTTPFAWYVMVGYRNAAGLPTCSIGRGSV